MRRDDAERWFMEQVKREHAHLRAFIRSKGVRSEEVDDLAQEAFLISLKKLDEFDRDGDFGAWVRQIARRVIANERRKESRRNRLLSDRVTDHLLEMADTGSLCALPGHKAEDELAALRECLSKMPKQSQELLRRRYFDELSPGAIGGLLGKPSNQIRQSLLRLRRALLSCMQGRQTMGTV